MFKNYLKIALRNIRRYKTFSLINIIGLAIGITCFIVLSLFIMDESGYDSCYKNADQIYRVCVSTTVNGKESFNSKSAGPTGETLKKDFPEVMSYTRVGYFGKLNFKYMYKSCGESDIYTADSTFFSVFQLPFICGDSKTALTNPNSVVITETISKKIFGNENPVGKTLISGNDQAFLVTGLMHDFPKNSSFGCDYLVSMSTNPASQENLWLNLYYSTYIVLKEGTDPRNFENKLNKVVYNYVGPQLETFFGVPIKDFLSKGNKYNLFLQPLKSIYLRSQRDYQIDPNSEWPATKNSDIAYIYIFASIAIFMLLIAVINFMNLATARSVRRAKEVGIRKTLGSNKYKLVAQFIMESIATCFLSVVLSIGLIKLVLPSFNNFFGKNLELNLFNDFYTIPVLLLFTVVIGILAGSYPAFYLSSFHPVQILKNYPGKNNRKHSLRSFLVVTQFAISIILIIGTIVIKNQLGYIQNKNLGFNKEQLISISDAFILGNRFEAFKSEILKNPNILSATNSSRMFREGIPTRGYSFNKDSNTKHVVAQLIYVDYDFLKTFQTKMEKGRFFSKDFSTDENAIILNESAVKEFGVKGDPIGKDLYQHNNGTENNSYRIIGVVRDFNYESLHNKIRPLVLSFNMIRASDITIRISSKDIPGTIGSIKKVWRMFVGEEELNIGFLDQSLSKLYKTEERTGKMTTIFSSIAIFIACLGLFGLAAFVTEQRTKEIGIRKIVGASVLEIVMLLSKDFTKWVVLANLIAWPVAYYFMNKWLQDFAYRINISWWIFVLSGGIALLIALLTVGYQAIKAATANPVESLRYE
jgi:putative ABC transport system permease protein